MKVSVILPVFNGEKFLPAALYSLAAQTFRDFEVVVVDDGSTDGTAEVLKDFRNMWNRDFLFHERRYPYRIGVTRSLIWAMSASAGAYVARHDADDVSAPDRLARQVAYLDSHPDCALVASRVHIIDEAGRVVRQGCRFPAFPVAQMLLGRNCVAHGSVMFRRSAYDAAGGYRAHFDCGQDLALWLRMRRYGRIKVLGECLYSLREHDGRVSVQRQAEQRAWATVARWAWWMGGQHDQG